jgi:hypothetical protein
MQNERNIIIDFMCQRRPLGNHMRNCSGTTAVLYLTIHKLKQVGIFMYPTVVKYRFLERKHNYDKTKNKPHKNLANILAQLNEDYFHGQNFINI